MIQAELRQALKELWPKAIEAHERLKELERKLERALDALVWGRRQPDFSNDDRTKLLSDVTDARIELWEYQRSQKTSNIESAANSVQVQASA